MGRLVHGLHPHPRHAPDLDSTGPRCRSGCASRRGGRQGRIARRCRPAWGRTTGRAPRWCRSRRPRAAWAAPSLAVDEQLVERRALGVGNGAVHRPSAAGCHPARHSPAAEDDFLMAVGLIDDRGGRRAGVRRREGQRLASESKSRREQTPSPAPRPSPVRAARAGGPAPRRASPAGRPSGVVREPPVAPTSHHGRLVAT